MKDKPWVVTTPFRLMWRARFASADAAWKRIATSNRKRDESLEAVRLRCERLGWAVCLEDEIELV